MSVPSADRLTEAAARLTAGLPALGTPERAEQERRYLHSDYVHLGVSLPELRRAVTAWRKELGPFDRDDTLGMAELLWSADVYEHRQAAAILLTQPQQARLLLPDDLPRIEALLRTSGTWALVDPLGVHAAGVIMRRHPGESGPVLDRWAGDADFWVRRSALLALLPGVRADEPDLTRVSRYADAMLEEREFFVRKVIGWVLREVSKRDPEFVVGWVEARIGRASGVTLREAVRHVPAEDRARVLAAYARGRNAGSRESGSEPDELGV